jgi:hypothetical protein
MHRSISASVRSAQESMGGNMKAVVNGSGDLYMMADTRHFIGKTVTVECIQKSGLYRVWYEEGPMIYTGSFAKRNLDFIDEEVA